MITSRTLVLAACGALALGAGPAFANTGHGHGSGHGDAGEAQAHGHAHAHGHDAKLRNAVFTGTVSAVASDGANLTVAVTKGNHWARPYVGRTLTVTAEKVNAADTNGDGAIDLADIRIGDVVRFHAKIATDGQAADIATRRVVDVTRSGETTG